MACDEKLAQRVRHVLAGQPGLIEKKMFGVGFMMHGNMACGVHRDKLIVRVGSEGHDSAMSKPHAVPFDITGRAMTAWVMVSAEGVALDADLEAWVREGVEYALSLPAK